VHRKCWQYEDRLRLLGQLSHGEMSVGDLEDALAIRQPTLSQQLGVLRTEGIVNTRREGKRIFYSVADPDVMRLLNILYHVYGTRSDPRSIESLASDCSTGASRPCRCDADKLAQSGSWGFHAIWHAIRLRRGPDGRRHFVHNRRLHGLHSEVGFDKSREPERGRKPQRTQARQSTRHDLQRLPVVKGGHDPACSTSP
jgi:ArsR family transcriptional regulator